MADKKAVDCARPTNDESNRVLNSRPSSPAKAPGPALTSDHRVTVEPAGKENAAQDDTDYEQLSDVSSWANLGLGLTNDAAPSASASGHSAQSNVQKHRGLAVRFYAVR